MEMPNWIKKVAGYAPDIALAISTGGISAIPTLAMRVLGKELLGTETATEQQVEEAVKNATPEQMIALTKANNEFKVQMKSLEVQEKKDEQIDAQTEHSTTQETIRNGDNSDSKLVRFTRPLQSWASLIAAFSYVFTSDAIDVYVLGSLLTLPFTYAGLRQAGKWKTADSLLKLGGKK